MCVDYLFQHRNQWRYPVICDEVSGSIRVKAAAAGGGEYIM
jgi:hypothetical protein